MNRLLTVPRLLAAVVLAAAVAAPLQAQTQDVSFAGVGDGIVKNGVYVGYYQLAVGPGNATLDVWCVDFLDAVHWNSEWEAHFTPLVDGGLGNTRHGNAAYDQYRRAAWLTTQFALNTTSQWGAIHAAIWVTMLPEFKLDGVTPFTPPSQLRAYHYADWGGSSPDDDYNTAVAYWLARADQNYTNVAPGSFAIITDEDAVGVPYGSGIQEYIYPTTVVPEPVTMILLGTGLVGTMGAARLRRRREDEWEADSAAGSEVA